MDEKDAITSIGSDSKNREAEGIVKYDAITAFQPFVLPGVDSEDSLEVSSDIQTKNDGYQQVYIVQKTDGEPLKSMPLKKGYRTNDISQGDAALFATKIAKQPLMSQDGNLFDTTQDTFRSKEIQQPSLAVDAFTSQEEAMLSLDAVNTTAQRRLQDGMDMNGQSKSTDGVYQKEQVSGGIDAGLNRAVMAPGVPFAEASTMKRDSSGSVEDYKSPQGLSGSFSSMEQTSTYRPQTMLYEEKDESSFSSIPREMGKDIPKERETSETQEQVINLVTTVDLDGQILCEVFERYLSTQALRA